ncbi:uncharacterized protein LOC128899116 [Dryobates pubescens]|uniref:uncharacterized protein LOC128899116 n=1 Tax=Dryobates pubescens TaxID=118200 RepID=UPI0023B92DFC|nr:uncharacterized protein LOC128899116 [Dryobates pubescens]
MFSRFPCFVAHALASNENRTTEGPHSLGESELPVPLSHSHSHCNSRIPDPDRTVPAITHASRVFVRTFVHKVYRVCRLPFAPSHNSISHTLEITPIFTGPVKYLYRWAGTPPAVPPQAQVQLHESLLGCTPVTDSELDTGVHPAGLLATWEQKPQRTLLPFLQEKVQGHFWRVEMTSQENLTHADDHIREGPGPSTSCQTNPYLFGGPQPAQATMTLEFVAVLSKAPSLEAGSEICVVIYKGPGTCQEFARMKEKKDKVMLGSARIPLAQLQGPPILYRYAIINLRELHGQQRSCQLEELSGDNLNPQENLKSRRGPFYRVMAVPPEEIKADGTWTFFEHIECSFTSSSFGSRYKAQMEHLERELLARPISWSSLEEMERRLEGFRASTRICLWDMDRGEKNEFYDNMEEVRNSIRNFLQGIIKCPKWKEQELLKILFAFHISIGFEISLSPASITEAEDDLQALSFTEDKYKALREKSKYFPALKKMCHSTTQGTLWIWLVPLLYAMKEEPGEDPLPLRHLPQQVFIYLRQDKEKQRKIQKMIVAHKTLIERCPPLAEKVLLMVSMKKLSKGALPGTLLPLKLLLEALHTHIIDSKAGSLQVTEKHLNLALENIVSRMDTWLQSLCSSRSPKPPMSPTMEDEILQCLNLIHLLLIQFLKDQRSFHTIKTMLKMLELFNGQEDILPASKKFQEHNRGESFSQLSYITKPWLEKSFQKMPTEKKAFLNNIDVSEETQSPTLANNPWCALRSAQGWTIPPQQWQELLAVKILSTEWTGDWKVLILKMFESWLQKVPEKHLVEFYQAFLKEENNHDTELEQCFTSHIIQWIRDLDKSEEALLKTFISTFSKTQKPKAVSVLSVLVEKMCWEVKKLRSVDSFDDTTGPVLANLLSIRVCDLISAVRECPLGALLGEALDEWEVMCRVQISDAAKLLLAQVFTLSSFVGHSLLLGDLPCSILREILEQKESFRDLVCTCDPSFCKSMTTVLEVRQQEFEQLEEQKQQRCSFLRLCRGIEDIIKVDRSAMEKSIGDSESFREQMVVQRFSIDGRSEMGSHVLSKYSQMMQKLPVVERSQCFLRLWKMRAEQGKATSPEDQVFSVEDVQEKIYKPAITDFQRTYMALRDFSITLGEVQSQFEKLLGMKDQLLEEFLVMEESEGQKGGEAAWVTEAVKRIENYLTLSKVVTTAKVIDALRQKLQLEGDFQVLSDLTRYVRRRHLGLWIGPLGIMESLRRCSF